MTKMTGLDAFYNESEDKIWFGNLISELARLNNENERMIAAAILSNYRLSKAKEGANKWGNSSRLTQSF
ncbi:hypothetical protein ACPSX4_23670, partial [Escherichia coli]